MSKKVIFLFFILFLFSLSSYGIDEKLYKNLTDRDRILLAISYYEVAKKYEALGKTELAKSYLSQALKIEKNVEKYAKGELEVPPKVIQIDWEKIFEEEKKESDKNKSESQLDEKKNNLNLKEREKDSLSYEDLIKKIVEDFFYYINTYDSINASNLFAEEVLIENIDIYITKQEMRESFDGFFNANYNKKYKFDSLEIKKIDDNSFIVKFKLIKDDGFFIFPNEDGYIKLGIIKSNNRYLFNKIFGKFEEEKTNFDFNNNKNLLPEEILKSFILYVTKKDYKKAIQFFNKEIWFDEFKILLTSDNIESNFNLFGITYINADINDIIDLQSIKEIEMDSTPFVNVGINFSNYRAFVAKFFVKEILPCNFDKDNFIFIFDKIENNYKIVGIAQE